MSEETKETDGQNEVDQNQIRLLRLPACLGQRFVLALDGTHDHARAFGYSGGHVALPEPGQDVVLDDPVGQDIGKGTFKAVSDLDADLAFSGGDDQQDPVVPAFLPNAPMAAEPVAVVGNVMAFQ